MRKIAILGSTGSIGTQAIDVALRHSDRFEVTALVAHSSSEKLFEQVRLVRPKIAALTIEPKEIPEDIKNSCQWMFGSNVLLDVVRACDADDVLVSVVGVVGLAAVMETLKCGKRVLLANKEPLVAGGELVTALSREKNLPLLPVDSEHSAIFQCLQGAGPNKPERLILTASGGPFRTWKKEDIYLATKEQALKHPNWNMGSKITIDSATMMNKGLEIIEARWLFGTPGDKIEVVVHPESIIHSMVEYADGAVIAQLGHPDMREPIQYALTWPLRLPLNNRKLNFADLAKMTFYAPDKEKFPALELAYRSLEKGGNMACIMNAANEAAVAAYLRDEIGFYDITDIVAECMDGADFAANPDIETIFSSNESAYAMASELIRRKSSTKSF